MTRITGFYSISMVGSKCSASSPNKASVQYIHTISISCSASNVIELDRPISTSKCTGNIPNQTKVQRTQNPGWHQYDIALRYPCPIPSHPMPSASLAKRHIHARLNPRYKKARKGPCPTEPAKQRLSYGGNPRNKANAKSNAMKQRKRGSPRPDIGRLYRPREQ